MSSETLIEVLTYVDAVRWPEPILRAPSNTRPEAPSLRIHGTTDGAHNDALPTTTNGPTGTVTIQIADDAEHVETTASSKDKMTGLSATSHNQTTDNATTATQDRESDVPEELLTVAPQTSSRDQTNGLQDTTLGGSNSIVSSVNRDRVNRADTVTKLHPGYRNYTAVTSGAASSQVPDGSRTANITGGSHTPTVNAVEAFSGNCAEVRAENADLKARLLHRQAICQICKQSLAGWSEAEKARHFQHHIDVITVSGNCPFCPTLEWQVMNQKQKQDHVTDHCRTVDKELAKKFWKDNKCRICHTSLESEDNFIDHAMTHDPADTRYCDCCGKFLGKLTPGELTHHDGICIDGPLPRSVKSEGNYCPVCGKDLNALASESDQKQHNDNCEQDSGGDNKPFCSRCGYDIAIASKEGKHSHARRCKVPGGPRGTYCDSCGLPRADRDHTQCDRERALSNEAYRRWHESHQSIPTFPVQQFYTNII